MQIVFPFNDLFKMILKSTLSSNPNAFLQRMWFRWGLGKNFDITVIEFD